MNRNQRTSVLAYWYGRPLTAQAAYARIGDYLIRLRSLNGVFANLYIGGRQGYTLLRPDLSNLEAELAANVNPEHGFINDDPEDKQFAITSRSVLGFGAYVTNAKLETSQTITLGVSCGQTFYPDQVKGTPNSVRLAVADETGTPELLRILLEEMITFWRPVDAVVSRPAVQDRLEQPAGEIMPGWLTYIADPSVGDALPADIHHEPFANGVLIEAAERPGADSDPGYIARILRVRDVLRPKGLLNMRAALSGAKEPAIVVM